MSKTRLKIRRAIIFSIPLIFSIILILGCLGKEGTLSVSEIVKKQQEYLNKQVSVKGKIIDMVGGEIPNVGNRYFILLQDERGGENLTVIYVGPRKFSSGDVVVLSGVLKSNFQMGPHIFDLVLIVHEGTQTQG